MEYKTLKLDFSDNMLKIKLNRPQVLNALSLELLAELKNALQRAKDDNNVRAIMLIGEGRGFSAGADLATTSIDRDIGKTIEESYNPVARLIYAMPKPIIAAVNGVAAGAGMSLALACDYRILSANAAFAFGFSGIALVADASGSFFLPRLIGRARALELAYTNRKVLAEEAISIGLAEVLLAAENFEENAEKYVKQLATGPSKAYALIKEEINQSLQNDFESQLKLEAELQIIAAASRDAHEGVKAFKEKRKAEFRGN